MGRKAFTLIELLVVIAVIGLLATVSVVAFSSSSKKARDAKRLADIKQLKTAIDLYYDKYGVFPSVVDNDLAGWEMGCIGGSGGADPFLQALTTDGLMNRICDPTGTLNTDTYRYSLYAAGTSACDATKGRFYVIEIPNMETSGNPYPGSPGWSCPLRNWQTEAKYVTGKFEIQ